MYLALALRNVPILIGGLKLVATLVVVNMIVNELIPKQEVYLASNNEAIQKKLEKRLELEKLDLISLLNRVVASGIGLGLALDNFKKEAFSKVQAFFSRISKVIASNLSSKWDRGQTVSSFVKRPAPSQNLYGSTQLSVDLNRLKDLQRKMGSLERDFEESVEEILRDTKRMSSDVAREYPEYNVKQQIHEINRKLDQIRDCNRQVCNLIKLEVILMKKNLFTILMMCLITMILSSQVSAVELPLRVVVDGERLQFPDAQPFIDPSERLQIPSRFIGESLGAKVSWDGKAQKATFVKGSTSLVLFIGKSEYQVNNQKKQMDTKALLKNERIFVPARYVAEAFGAGVAWDKAIRTVYINTDGSVPTLNQPPAEDEIYDWIKVETEKTYVEYSMEIVWSSDPLILNARYDAAKKMFAERYGDKIAEEVFAYTRKKQTRQDTIKLTDIQFNGQVVSVFAHDITFEVKVWRKGVL